MTKLRQAFLGLVFVAVTAALLLGAAGYAFMRRSFPQVQGDLDVAGLQARVEIRRDQWGVPHIYAQNEHDLFFAQGYVHAQDRLWQMDFNRRVAAGRLSEVLGASTLESDRFLRTIGLYRAARADLVMLSPEVIEALQAYADGVNSFVETHRDRLPIEFTLLAYQPEPWTPTDSLAWGKVMAMDLGGNWESELLAQQLAATLGEEKMRELLTFSVQEGPCVIPEEAKSYAYASQGLTKASAQVQELLGPSGVSTGSNNWVVDGTMTESGRPLLANDPHLGIQMPSIWYEVHLVGGELDVVGASFPGAPGVIIGHNQHIAWGVTNAGPDVQDLYVEKINPLDPDQYEYRGQWVDMQVLEEEIHIKGRLEPEGLIVRMTHHGPVMTPVLEAQQQVLTLRWTALEGGRLFQSVYLLDRASNWDEFRAALLHWQAPSQNFVYADREGNIGYQLPGSIPIRAHGNGLVPSPGWTGEYEWSGYIPFEELPFVYNPPTHFIVTANNKIVPDDYPYFISCEWAEPYRAQRIVDLLQADDSLTVDDMRDIQADLFSIPGAVLREHVLRAGPADWRQERAFRFVEQWSADVTRTSGAAGFSEVLLWRLMENTIGDELRRAGVETFSSTRASLLLRLLDDPNNVWFDVVGTPEVETRDGIVRLSIEETIDYWGRHYGDMPGNKDDLWAWGRVHTVTFAHPLGSVKPLNLIFNRGPVGTGGSGETVNNGGYERGDFRQRVVSSYRQIIDVGSWGNSRSQHTTGQSGQPWHRHYADMIKAWAQVEHHPMLFDQESIAAHQEALLVLNPQ